MNFLRLYCHVLVYVFLMIQLCVLPSFQSSMLLPIVRKIHFSPKSLIRSALLQSKLEYSVLLSNSEANALDHIKANLIALPLAPSFSSTVGPLQGQGRKLQFSDKCSLPPSIGRRLFKKPYEVPWIFEIKKVFSAEDDDAAGGNSNSNNNNSINNNDIDGAVAPDLKMRNEISSVQLADSSSISAPVAPLCSYCSPLDFRAPEAYIFMPQWLMRFLHVSPYDVVTVSLVRLQLASLVKVELLSKNWNEIMDGQHPTSLILEKELNKYSSLTAGADITVSFNRQELLLRVKETRGKEGLSVRAVRIQDADVQFDIDQSSLSKSQ